MRFNFVVTSNYGKENDGPSTSLNVKKGHAELGRCWGGVVKYSEA